MSTMSSAGWISLELLKSRFTANLTALSTRYPDEAARLAAITPAEPYSIRTEGDVLHLAVGNPPRALPLVFSPQGAQVVINKMFPTGKCDESTLVAGEDLGWLWNGLYRLPSFRPTAPGYRPPLYFLMQDVERLWAILHIQDWQQMLADPRVRLFIGEQTIPRFEKSLHAEPMCPWPKLSVTIDKSIWPAGVSLDTLISAARLQQSQDLVDLLNSMQLRTGKQSPLQLAKRIKSGQPIRILGMTSRYTTFLQYSMRDWLEGMRRMGHETELMIEPFDHQVPNNMSIAMACAAFKPDVIVAIDHPRPALFGVLDDVPVVMWVQDRLPAIFDKACGQKQGRMDYVIGYARQELTQRFGFPASRFMPAMVGVNDRRFAPRTLSVEERARFSCDVSFVSHATMPAEQIVAEEKQKVASDGTRALLDDLFDQMRAVYDAGNFISTGDVLERMVDETLQRRHLSGTRDVLIELITHRVNNSLFRHQAVRWAAHWAEQAGATLHLYGNGWEKHPEFARYARGVADNQDQLPVIYQASAINLQVTPFGAVHQRLLDGLAAGGFFLLRSVTADQHEVLRKQIWEWCQQHQVSSGAGMLQKCDAQLSRLLEQFHMISTVDPRRDIEYFYAGLDEAAMDQFQRTANTMWAESPQVTFSTQRELTEQLDYFRANPQQRERVAAAMRERVLQTHTYQAISKRMLEFIAADLTRGAAMPMAA